MHRLLIALLVAWAGACQAATVLPVTFDQLVARADGVVVASVAAIAAHKEADGIIYRYVELADLQLLKGRYDGERLTLRVAGGQVGSELMPIAGVPEFAAGERVMLFVRGNGEELVPFVGWHQGVFRLQDGASGETLVASAAGASVVGIAGGRLQLAAAAADRGADPAAAGVIVESIEGASGIELLAGGTPALTDQRATVAASRSPMSLAGFAAAIRGRLQPQTTGTAADTPLTSVAPGEGALFNPAE